MKHLISKKNRALLSELVRTDFRLRYQGSVLGYTWSLLRPLLLFIIMYVVFVKFLHLGGNVPHYPVYLLLGLVLWNFFSEMTNLSLTSIVGRGELIRKIRIPRWIVVLTSSFTALINLVLNLLVVVVFMVINKVEFHTAALAFPLFVIEIYLFALGLSLLLSAAYVKYRDVVHIWEVFMQGFFYLTPVLFPLSLITNDKFKQLIMLNPMAQALQDARHSLITSQTQTISSVFRNPVYIALPPLIILAVLILGVLYFRREAKDFAENL